jgi:hypothetical protein
MDNELFDLLDKYIEAKIDYAIASEERDEEGYTSTPLRERKKMESIKSEILKKISSLKTF